MTVLRDTESPENLFFGLNSQLLKLRLKQRWSQLHFTCISAVHIISFYEQRKVETSMKYIDKNIHGKTEKLYTEKVPCFQTFLTSKWQYLGFLYLKSNVSIRLQTSARKYAGFISSLTIH